MARPIPFCSLVGFQAFSFPWWRDVWRWVTRGVWQDIFTYWRRARYGWAPRDTWSLDRHLAHVCAGSLAHLAKHSHGWPSQYPGGYDAWTGALNGDYRAAGRAIPLAKAEPASDTPTAR